MSEENSFLRLFAPAGMLCGNETTSEFLTPAQGNLKSIIGLLTEELTASND